MKIQDTTWRRAALVVALTLSLAGTALAQEDSAPSTADPAQEGAADEAEPRPEFSLGGLAFGDLYVVPNHHLEEGDGSAGFWLRRLYLTFDADSNNLLYGRVRVEVNQSGGFETYDYQADFKDLYLGIRLGRHDLLFGLAPSLTFDLIEGVWGLRYLMRTPLDLQGVASRDTGVRVSGPLTGDNRFRYRAMIGTGAEFGNETGDGRNFMFAVSWHPSEPWTVDLHAGYEVLPGNTDRRILQGFVGYVTPDLRFGAQYSNQDRQDDPPLELASAFVVKRLSDSLSLIGRIDRLFEPSPRGDTITYVPFDPTARATLLLAGLEVRTGQTFRLTPNVIVVTYDRNEEGVRPPTDLYLKLTFFLDLE